MRQRRGMNFMGNSYMGWEEKGKGFFSRKGRKGGEGDTFYLPLSTWRPWREVLGFTHAKVAKGAKKLISARVCFA